MIEKPKQERTVDVKLQDDCFEIIHTQVEKYPFYEYDNLLKGLEMANTTAQINMGRTEAIIKDLKAFEEDVKKKQEEERAFYKKKQEELKAKAEVAEEVK